VSALPVERRRLGPLVALLAADGVSRAGNAITIVAVPLIALQIAGTPLAIAAAGIAATLPLVVGGVVGGWVVDRLGFRPAMLVDAASGATVLAIPENLTGADSEEGRLVGMARLRLAWPDLGPVSPETRRRLLVTLSPQDKVNEPATQLSVYARFLTHTVWSNPGGLVVRGFRKGSPFEGDELFVSVPDGRGFAARCPVEVAGSGLEELCRVTFRHRGMDVNIRFPRAIIADWELMLGGVRRTVDRLVR